MSDRSANHEPPMTWAGSSSRPNPPERYDSTITIRGFDVPQSSQIGASTPSPALISSDENFGLERHRRSSIAERIGSIANVGGPNSINKFASSWQRAAGFYDISHRPSQLFNQTNSDGAENSSERTPPDPEQRPSRSYLGSGLQRNREDSSDSAVLDDSNEFLSTSPDVGARITEHRRLSTMQADSGIFQNEPNVASSLGGSYATSYGALSSRINEPAKRQADRLYAKQQDAVSSNPSKESEPLLTKQVESPSGQPMTIVVGQSTLPQTIFNSVNVLIGVGMLSLPLAIRFSGWLIGLIFFFLSAVTTSYTAKLLAKCLDVDQSLITFADVAYISYGHRARVIVSILFSLELIAACVALVILFADSIDLLITGWGVTAWKIVCGIIIIPLGFMPMRFLSFTSILGILSCMMIVVAVFIDGIIKPHALGSLRDPAPTYLFPKDWRTLPLAFGLLMAPWGGHSVFPNIYRDMRHPRKYKKAVNITYVFTYFLEAAIAIAGYLMFGEGVRDEITANLFLTEGYPKWLSIVILVAIAIIPLTKIPLNARPIISTFEIFLGLEMRALGQGNNLSGMSTLTRGALRFAIRILVPIILVVIAIVVPSFDRVMSLLGSLACFSICIVLPCSFHLKIFGKDLDFKHKVLDWFLIVVCTILAIVGTVCAFLPKKLLGAA